MNASPISYPTTSICTRSAVTRKYGAIQFDISCPSHNWCISVLVVDSLDSLSAVSTPACFVLDDFAKRVRFTSHGPYAHDRFFFVPRH